MDRNFIIQSLGKLKTNIHLIFYMGENTEENIFVYIEHFSISITNHSPPKQGSLRALVKRTHTRQSDPARVHSTLGHTCAQAWFHIQNPEWMEDGSETPRKSVSVRVCSLYQQQSLDASY